MQDCSQGLHSVFEASVVNAKRLVHCLNDDLPEESLKDCRQKLSVVNDDCRACHKRL